MQASQTASQTVDATANSATNTSVDTVATLQDQLVGMGEGFVRALPGIAIALVVLLVTWIVARFAARIADLLIGNDIFGGTGAVTDGSVAVEVAPQPFSG